MYDVAICGAGLAGLSLARQLRLEQPDLSVALLDRRTGPLPVSAWKVGESTVEYAAHYFADYLQLGDLFGRTQLRKLGLRFFYPSDQGFAHRPELGLSGFPGTAASYQIDRGILENDLREMAREDDTVFLEGARVGAIDIGAGDNPHTVQYTLPDGSKHDLQCRWLVDASGRRQLLQNQLKLRRPPVGHPTSSAWFRLEGRIDVDDLVPASDTGWQERVADRRRYFSTNHLVGAGYWVWIIPLSGGATSIGIVARNDLHPYTEYRTYAKSLEWLGRHEPELARLIDGKTPLDFKGIETFSYSSEEVISPDRWSCVGEAGLFADPYYSPGSDLIGLANILTADLIRRDAAGDHDPQRVAGHSRYLISLCSQLTQATQDAMPYLGDEMVSLARTVWDTAAAWGSFCPPLFNRLYDDPARSRRVAGGQAVPLFLLSGRMRAVFDQWLALRAQGRGHLSFGFFDYLGQNWLFAHRQANLRRIDDDAELSDQARANAAFFEDLAGALFLLAVEDVFPEEMHRFANRPAMDLKALTLQPADWNKVIKSDRGRDKIYEIYSEIRSCLVAGRDRGQNGQ